jgi:hypothetical protein
MSRCRLSLPCSLSQKHVQHGRCCQVRHATLVRIWIHCWGDQHLEWPLRSQNRKPCNMYIAVGLGTRPSHWSTVVHSRYRFQGMRPGVLPRSPQAAWKRDGGRSSTPCLARSITAAFHAGWLRVHSNVSTELLKTQRVKNQQDEINRTMCKVLTEKAKTRSKGLVTLVCDWSLVP